MRITGRLCWRNGVASASGVRSRGRPVPRVGGAQQRVPPRVPDLACQLGVATCCAALLAGSGSRTGSARIRPRDCATAPHAPGVRLSEEQVSDLFLLPVSLREHALWRVVYDSGGSVTGVLSLDADQLDLSRHQARPRSSDPLAGTDVGWREGTSQLLHWLLAGRTWGPVFVTTGEPRCRPPQPTWSG